jgi:hypothetical protein
MDIDPLVVGGVRDASTGPWDRLLDFGPDHVSEPDHQRQEQPDDAGDADVGPLPVGEGTVEEEQAALSVLEVDPGLKALEPALAGGEQAGRRQSVPAVR